MNILLLVCIKKEVIYKLNKTRYSCHNKNSKINHEIPHYNPVLYFVKNKTYIISLFWGQKQHYFCFILCCYPDQLERSSGTATTSEISYDKSNEHSFYTNCY